MFILACVVLVLFSGLFYLWVPKERAADRAERNALNLQWYHLRQAELTKDGSTELIEDMKLRLLEDAPGKNVRAGSSVVNHKNFPRWVLLPLVAIASSSLYYVLGSAPDVQINARLEAVNEHTTPEQVQDIMHAIEARLQRRPDNLHYRALLARFYMGREDYQRAADTYSALALDSPGDAQTLAYAAQAQYLAANRQLGGSAQMLAEQSLAIDPQQRTALGLLGMAAYEKGRYRAAIGYWERLIALEPPGSQAALMIAGIVERARAALGEQGEQVAAASPQGEVTPGVSVRVSLPEGAEVDASSTVFVLARAAGSDSRMPIAVQRLEVSSLPAVIRLDDGSSMAGQKLSAADSIVVIVQLSPDGRPGEAHATWLGSGGPMRPSLETEPLEIVLTPVE